MKKTIIISLALLTLFLLFCKEETPVESEPKKYTYTGKVYTLVDSQKIYTENVKVFFREKSTITNSEGAFTFDNVPSGKYPIKFIYSIQKTIFDSTITEVTIGTENRFEEYFLYEQKAFDKDLFPLQVGNIWVYGYDDLSKEYCKIVETVVIDNITYYKMEIKNPIRNTVRYSNYRIDSQTGYLYRMTVVLITDLSLGEGDHQLQNSNGQTIKWITVDVFDKELFGENKRVVSHSIDNGEVASCYEFVSGIGVIRYSSSSFTGFEEKNLLGAIINNVEYGDTSHIEYNKNIAFYPLAIGNKWIYYYNKFVEDGDTIRSSELKREVIGEELMSNGITYFKIKNTFDDSLIVFSEWQKMDSLGAKLYGFDAAKNTQYTIEDYSPTESGFGHCKSYMPSILTHEITDLSPSFSDSTKSYYGWDSSAPCFSIVSYKFIKDVGISEIVVSCRGDSTTIIEEIKLVSWSP